MLHFRLPSVATRNCKVTRTSCVRAGALAGGAKVVMTASAAESASKKPKRVQEVLDNIKDHPIQLKSQPMYYEAQPPTPLPEVIR